MPSTRDGAVSGAPCSDHSATWTYDARDRLVQEVNGTGTTTDFTLDVVGNVLTETPSPGSAITRTYSGQRLLTQSAGATAVEFFYDAYGNQACAAKSTFGGSSCPDSGADLWSYLHDPHGSVSLVVD